MRTLAYTTANPPTPQVGTGTIFWEDASNILTTGLDICGYDWQAGQEFVVSNTPGNQMSVKACGSLVTWVTGATNSQTLWGATIIPSVEVTDLHAALVTGNSVQLAWTAVTSPQNLPVSYDLRMRTDGPVTDANWFGSTAVTGLGAPQAAGQPETFTIQNLAQGSYYFAIKVKLSNGDYSLLSGCVCAYVSDQDTALSKGLGACISFTGSVTGLSSDGAFYCQSQPVTKAVRAVPASGQQIPSEGSCVTVTGVLTQEPDFCGPVLQQAVVGQPVGPQPAGLPRCLAMANRSIGGCDPVFGGTIEPGVSNLWALVKTWGMVSNLSTSGGCTFYISDGCKLTGSQGCNVEVISAYPAPLGLANGAFAVVEGISRVSNLGQRQVEVVDNGNIQVCGQ